jgi:hypothetical protein
LEGKHDKGSTTSNSIKKRPSSNKLLPVEWEMSSFPGRELLIEWDIPDHGRQQDEHGKGRTCAFEHLTDSLAAPDSDENGTQQD